MFVLRILIPTCCQVNRLGSCRVCVSAGGNRMWEADPGHFGVKPMRRRGGCRPAHTAAWHFFMCNLRLYLTMKLLEQSVQEYGRSPECTLRFCFPANLLPQCSQANGRSPVCTLWCVFRWPDCVKRLPHWAQLYGRSPVCTRTCVSRLRDDRLSLQKRFSSSARGCLAARLWTSTC
uniref:Uncharacterized protein n=1 Tax=Myripristis murdjan TaxID=586833 RepID=A0A667YYW4_9TELE